MKQLIPLLFLLAAIVVSCQNNSSTTSTGPDLEKIEEDTVAFQPDSSLNSPNKFRTLRTIQNCINGPIYDSYNEVSFPKKTNKNIKTITRYKSNLYQSESVNRIYHYDDRGNLNRIDFLQPKERQWSLDFTLDNYNDEIQMIKHDRNEYGHRIQTTNYSRELPIKSIIEFQKSGPSNSSGKITFEAQLEYADKKLLIQYRKFRADRNILFAIDSTYEDGKIAEITYYKDDTLIEVLKYTYLPNEIQVFAEFSKIKISRKYNGDDQLIQWTLANVNGEVEDIIEQIEIKHFNHVVNIKSFKKGGLGDLEFNYSLNVKTFNEDDFIDEYSTFELPDPIKVEYVSESRIVDNKATTFIYQYKFNKNEDIEELIKYEKYMRNNSEYLKPVSIERFETIYYNSN